MYNKQIAFNILYNCNIIVYNNFKEKLYYLFYLILLHMIFLKKNYVIYFTLHTHSRARLYVIECIYSLHYFQKQ